MIKAGRMSRLLLYIGMYITYSLDLRAAYGWQGGLSLYLGLFVLGLASRDSQLCPQAFRIRAERYPE
jgi:hypothetical protein